MSASLLTAHAVERVGGGLSLSNRLQTCDRVLLPSRHRGAATLLIARVLDQYRRSSAQQAYPGRADLSEPRNTSAWLMTQQVDTSRRMPLWALAALTILALLTGVLLAVSAWVLVQLRASLAMLEG